MHGANFKVEHLPGFFRKNCKISPAFIQVHFYRTVFGWVKTISSRDVYYYQQDMTAQIGKTENAKEAQKAFAEKRPSSLWIDEIKAQVSLVR
jgi:hypothetical protein